MTEPLVGVVMGSASDWETMQHCARQLEAFGVPFETRVLSAHRTPRELTVWIADAESRGAEVFIAAAGMAAALPGVVAAQTTRPVLGVPMESKLAGGLDSLLSMVQMPGGIPVGVLAVGKAGAGELGDPGRADPRALASRVRRGRPQTPRGQGRGDPRQPRPFRGLANGLPDLPRGRCETDEAPGFSPPGRSACLPGLGWRARAADPRRRSEPLRVRARARSSCAGTRRVRAKEAVPETTR